MYCSAPHVSVTLADPVLEGIGESMKLNESYSGWLEAYNPYSSDMRRIKVGNLADEVELISSWTDKGTTWHLVRIGSVEGWLLESETSTEIFSSAD